MLRIVDMEMALLFTPYERVDDQNDRLNIYIDLKATGLSFAARWGSYARGLIELKNTLSGRKNGESIAFSLSHLIRKW